MRAAVDLLLVSVVRLTALCLPYLERSGAGRIVNITSQHGARADRQPRALELRAARHRGLGEVARARGSGQGITVNSIAPGSIDTDRIRELDPDGPSEEDLARSRCAGSARRARSVTSSPSSAPSAASYVSGSVVFVDGAASRGRLVGSASPAPRSSSACSGSQRLRSCSGGSPPTTSSSSRIARSRSPTRSRSRAGIERRRATSTTSTSSCVASASSSSSSRSPGPTARRSSRRRALTPDGTTDEERDRQNAEDMQRSEQIAAVVALRALGYDVTATPRGVLVTSVYTDVPAAKVLEPNDVIVGVNGVAVRTRPQLRREIGRVAPGDDVRLTHPARRQGQGRHGADDRRTRRIPRAQSSASSSTRTRRSSCRSTSTSTSAASAARRPAFPSRSRSPVSSAAT